MASEIKLPELGENVAEGEVVDIRVSPGQEVHEGEPLLEVEAEKTTVEVPSPATGRVSKVLVKKGDRVRAGQGLFLLDAGDGKPKASEAEVPAEEPKQEPKQEPKPEKEQPAAAAPPKAEEPPRPVSPPEKPAPATPAAPAPSREPSNGRQTAPAAIPSADEEKVVPAGPATRRLARELGIDLAQVPGTAPAGRVTQDDVKAYVRRLASSGPTPSGVKVPPLPDFEHWGPIEKTPLDAVRRKTAEQMALSWSQVPHVTHHDVADITEIDAFRRQQQGKGPKLTVTAFALKAAAIALRQFPQFNASIDVAGGQLIVKHYYHIGLAVDTERGLLVPVIRDVDKKSVHDLAQEMADLAERARQKKLTADEMRGGTFTISNLGGIGGTAFTPIVNYPEVAILGMSRARLQPVAQDGQFVPRLLLPLSLSYDHRVIDGAAAARFTQRLAEMLENPMVMLLHA